MDFKSSKSPAGYPFPSKPSVPAVQVIEQAVQRAQEQIRKEQAPKEPIKALGKEAIVKEKDLGNVKELNVTQKPKMPSSGNNSSF